MRKRLALSMLSVFAAIAVLALLIWRGDIALNHPSESDYPVRGVDVSHYQGEIDFQRLAEQGMQFAFIKATEGSASVDERLEQNLENVQSAPMRAGFYHFFSYDSPGSAQAENFIMHVPALEDMLPPVIDVEFYGDKASNPPERAQVEPELRALVNAVEQEYGMKPILYCTQRAYRLYIQNAFEDCDLWIRSVYWRPRIDRGWTFWQYTDRAKLEGYSGEEPCIDLNVFCGTAEEFAKYPQ